MDTAHEMSIGLSRTATEGAAFRIRADCGSVTSGAMGSIMMLG